MIELRDVEVAAGGRVLVRVPRLSIDAGTVTAVVGPNGSGKSTLLHTIALGSPASGEIDVSGHPAGSNDALRLVGYAPAEPPLHKRLTAREHLALIEALWERPHDEGALSRWGLETCGSVVAGQLSTGQRRRLCLAMSLVHDPVVWLLDEPWNALDDDGAAILRNEMGRFRERGGAVVAATHAWPDDVARTDTWSLEDQVVVPVRMADR